MCLCHVLMDRIDVLISLGARNKGGRVVLTFPVTHGNPSKTSASNVSSQMMSLGTLTNSLMLAYILSLILSFYVTYTLQKGRYSKIFIQEM